MVLAACNLLTAPSNQTTISGPPVVQIAAPPPNATYLEDVTVNIQALISNAGADIDRIEIVVDEQILETLSSPNPGGAASFSIARTWTASGAGSHTIGITAFRADGSSSTPAAVMVNVVSQETSPTAELTTSSDTQSSGQQPAGGNNTQTSRSTATQTTPPKPTDPPTPAASNTPNTPFITVNQGINVRSGPSTKFNPVLGTMKQGDTAPLLGKNTDGSWFKIQYYNSNNAWVFAQYVSPSVDVAQLVVDPGPPVPTDTPVPPTAIPATPVPTTAPTTANIVLGNIGFNPPLATCGQTIAITIDVANLGQQATDRGGSISIKDYHSASGQEVHSTQGAFGPLAAGQTINYGGMFLTITTYVGEEHRLVITLNPDGAVPETSNADNSREYKYTLQPGC
jgi:uncharacterized protein YraI